MKLSMPPSTWLAFLMQSMMDMKVNEPSGAVTMTVLPLSQA